MSARTALWIISLLCLFVGASGISVVRESVLWLDFGVSTSVAIGCFYIGLVLSALLLFTRK